MEDGVPTDIVIYGASGYGAVVSRAVNGGLTSPGNVQTVAFIDDMPSKIGTRINGVPVISFDHWADQYRGIGCVIAVSNGRIRSQLAAKVIAAGGHFPELYSGPELAQRETVIGAGAFIAPPTHIGPFITIGEHVQVMAMVSLGHDIRIDRFATICPGAIVSGKVVVEEGAFLGAGSIIIDGAAMETPIVIGAWSTVAAGAVVTKSVPPFAKVMGNPARPLRDLAARRRRIEVD